MEVDRIDGVWPLRGRGKTVAARFRSGGEKDHSRGSLQQKSTKRKV